MDYLWTQHPRVIECFIKLTLYIYVSVKLHRSTTLMLYKLVDQVTSRSGVYLGDTGGSMSETVSEFWEGESF